MPDRETGLTRSQSRSYARAAMPAPDRPGANQRNPDLSAIPSFLRGTRLEHEGERAAAPDPASSRGSLAIPRPSTPAATSRRPDQPLDPAALPMPSLSR